MYQSCFARAQTALRPFSRHALARTTFLREQRKFSYLHESSLKKFRYDAITVSYYSTVTPQSSKTPIPSPVTNTPIPTETQVESDPSSQIEKSVKAFRKEEVQKTAQNSESSKIDTKIAPTPRSLRKRIWDEIVHYYHGFRLLFIDVRISTRLLFRVLRGADLSRREHKQLVRTTSDVFRLVPFSVFIIVPFMELLLPIVLKLFPNLLPSTFQSASDEKTKVKAQLKVKLEMAKFLQTTLDEMAVKKKGETHSHAAKEFAIFCENIRESGHFANSEEILKFSKLFEDELTLDSLARQQLVALCRLLDIQTIGTTQLLRFQLRMRLKNLKNDDAMIKKEGLESLTVHELQMACRARGMRSLGLPEDKLRFQLAQWLDLSLRESIPPSLLLLSRAMLLPENVKPSEQLRETITQLPKEVITEAKYKIGETEGKVDNRTKLEIIRQEELAIKREKLEEREAKLEEEAREVAQAAKRKTKQEDLSKEGLPSDGLRDTELLIDKAPLVKEEDTKLTKEDLDGIESALETIAVEKERLLIEKEELDDLKEELKDYEEDVKELAEVTKGTGELKEAKGASRLYKKVNAMIRNLDGVIEKLNEEKRELSMKGDKEATRDDIIGIQELMTSMNRLRKTSDDSRIKVIQEILDSMDSDHDGKIEIDVVLRVIDEVGRENVKVSPAHMKEIIEMMLNEEAKKKRDQVEKEKKEKTSSDS